MTDPKKQYSIKVLVSSEMNDRLQALPRSFNVSAYLREQLSALLFKGASKTTVEKKRG